MLKYLLIDLSLFFDSLIITNFGFGLPSFIIKSFSSNFNEEKFVFIRKLTECC